MVLGLLDRPALDAAGVSQVQSQPYLNLKGRGVLLGFVDARVTKSMVSGAWMNSSASGDSRMAQSPLSIWLTSSFMVPQRFSRPYPHWGLG